MKNIIFLFIFFLASCAPLTNAQTSVMQGTPTGGALATPASALTAQPSSTPTIGYHATAQAAQSTSSAAQATTDAINRMMVDATEQSNGLTATSNANHLMLIGWTSNGSQPNSNRQADGHSDDGNTPGLCRSCPRHRRSNRGHGDVEYAGSSHHGGDDGAGGRQCQIRRHECGGQRLLFCGLRNDVDCGVVLADPARDEKRCLERRGR